MPRPRITNVLPCRNSNSDSDQEDDQVQHLDDTIFDIWRKAFPHLPSRFGPGWDYQLDDLAKIRTRAYRKYRKSDVLETQQENKGEVKVLSRDIRKQVRRNKKEILDLIINEFSRLENGSVQIESCCISEPRTNAGHSTHRLSADSAELTLIMKSDLPRMEKLLAIVDLVPYAHLTRRIGVLLIQDYPLLQFRNAKGEHEDVQPSVNSFLDRYHRLCHCGSICKEQQHACC